MADVKNRMSNVVTAPSVAPPSVDPTPKKGGRSRKILSDAEREARKQQLLDEPKDAKFRRLANARMPKALKAISQVAYLANRSQYEFTAEQCDKIVQALTKAVTTVRDKFLGNRENGATFAL